MNQGDITIAEATSDTKLVTPPPKVYNLPDEQGRMASYYNAMELPEAYTNCHGVPRTNQFIPVGYCCMEAIAPKSRGYLGKKPRNGYRGTANVPAPAVEQSDRVKSEEKAVMLEARAPPSSPEYQLIIIADATAELLEQTAPISKSGDETSQAPLSAVTPSYQPIQPPVQPQSQQPLCLHPAVSPCASCAHYSAQPQLTASVAHDLPVSPMSTQMPPYPSTICRRWLIGTCRRGPACRNRHHVLHETDAQLHAIKEAHLATMRFYSNGVGLPAPTGAVVQEIKKSRSETVQTAIDVLPPLINWAEEVEESKQENKQTGFVEAHIDGIGKVKIPVSALTEQLKGLKLEEGTKEIPAESTRATDLDDDTHSEPLPDYSLAMPLTPSPMPKPAVRPATQNATQPIRHRPLQATQPFIHSADRFRATYDPSHLVHPSHLSHLPLYSRRHVPQDFVPRHVLDRALRQYISGSLKGRRLLEKREVRGAAGRKRAILAGMQRGVGEGEKRVEDNNKAEVKDGRADRVTENRS